MQKDTSVGAKHFKCNRMITSRIWKRVLENYGEKFEKLRHIPMNRRGTIKSIANSIGVPKKKIRKKIVEFTSFQITSILSKSGSLLNEM